MKTTANKDEELRVAAFRAPKWLREEAQTKCDGEDITFSQLMRRAMRRELGHATANQEQEEAK